MADLPGQLTATLTRRRGIRACAERGRAAWWALPGRDRIAVEGMLLVGVLLAAGWRAGHLGLVQADFVLTFLGGLAGVVTLYRGTVYRPQPDPSPEALPGRLQPVHTTTDNINPWNPANHQLKGYQAIKSVGRMAQLMTPWAAWS
ncbi:hypothetical protein ACIRP2_39295 [Streptomyces sp. NPDC101194]|uniref:hypothetical protein n=1 Tax=Streptomyces sp. NPDC101194 TaxID=3366127 RepID=UPI00380DE16F